MSPPGYRLKKKIGFVAAGVPSSFKRAIFGKVTKFDEAKSCARFKNAQRLKKTQHRMQSFCVKSALGQH